MKNTTYGDEINQTQVNTSALELLTSEDKVNIDGVEYYQLKLDKDLDNNFYKFRNNNFTNLIFKDVDTRE